jgi:hypothetical protein
MKAWTTWIAIGVTFLGCSSSSGSGADSCGKVAPCGGNIVGTWKVVDACTGSTSGSSGSPISSCPSATTQVGNVNASGTATFNADMTYSVSVTESASETLDIPMSCLSSGTGTTVTCADLATSLGTALGGDDAGATTTCTTSGSSCNCTVTLAGMTDNETGTYSISGDTVTTTPTAAPGTTVSTGGGSYCVQGSDLHLIAMAMTGPAGATGPSSDIVGVKQ